MVCSAAATATGAPARTMAAAAPLPLLQPGKHLHRGTDASEDGRRKNSRLRLTKAIGLEPAPMLHTFTLSEQP